MSLCSVGFASDGELITFHSKSLEFCMRNSFIVAQTAEFVKPGFSSLCLSEDELDLSLSASWLVIYTR